LSPVYVPASVAASGGIRVPSGGSYANASLAQAYDATLRDLGSGGDVMATLAALCSPAATPVSQSLRTELAKISGTLWLPGGDAGGFKDYVGITCGAVLGGTKGVFKGNGSMQGTWGGSYSNGDAPGLLASVTGAALSIANACSSDVDVVAPEYIGLTYADGGAPIYIDAGTREFLDGSVAAGYKDMSARTNLPYGFRIAVSMEGSAASMAAVSGTGADPGGIPGMTSDTVASLAVGTFGYLTQIEGGGTAHASGPGISQLLPTGFAMPTSGGKFNPMAGCAYFSDAPAGMPIRLWLGIRPGKKISAGSYTGRVLVTVTPNTP
jgi:hypothetical protein